MADPQQHTHVEVTEGDRTVAAADITVSASDATARASLHVESGHLAPGTRARLVDAVMDQPEVRGSDRLVATVPRGDSESLQRLRERTFGAVTRAAGSTALFTARIPH